MFTLNSLWRAKGVLWGLFWEPWALFATPWGATGPPWDTLWTTLGLHWGVLGVPWDHFGTPWAPCWDAWGSFWAISEIWCPQEPHRKPMALKYRACAQKQASWNLPAGPGGPAGPARLFYLKSAVPSIDGETVHELQFRPSVPHAPGVRMT